jgi:hypothetical protein
MLFNFENKWCTFDKQKECLKLKSNVHSNILIPLNVAKRTFDTSWICMNFFFIETLQVMESIPQK